MNSEANANRGHTFNIANANSQLPICQLDYWTSANWTIGQWTICQWTICQCTIEGIRALSRGSRASRGRENLWLQDVNSQWPIAMSIANANS